MLTEFLFAPATISWYDTVWVLAYAVGIAMLMNTGFLMLTLLGGRARRSSK
ncbi:MAG: hypothetical protein HYV26_16575 [Candidatus Hydrogenedentes bacterium]|nr:hypothetical protein [Candidatus Hydrogenedentota bacterium]MBI3117794.1 hypothetical protein [Candidatus Hydrogenedentota bacterium]